MCVAYLSTDVDNFHHAKAKTFCMASFLAKKKKDACEVASVFFFSQESLPYKKFCSRMMKNHQHQHKGKPHTQEKFQGTAISVEDAMIKIRGLNLCGAHCILRSAKICHHCILGFMYSSNLKVQ